jgi:hypothetical protein
MEPLIIVTLGVLIGGLVVAMDLPVFKLGSVVQARSAGSRHIATKQKALLAAGHNPRSLPAAPAKVSGKPAAQRRGRRTTRPVQLR